MEKPLPIQFRECLYEAFEKSPYKSERALAVDAEIAPNRISKLFNGQFDHSKDGPGFFSVVRLCERLGITPDFAAGLTDKWRNVPSGQTMDAITLLDSVSQALEERPTAKELGRLFIRSGQRIEAFSRYMDFFDIYEPLNPQTRKVTIRQVGKKSLAAIRMKSSNVATLQNAYDNAPLEFQEKIFLGHERAWNSGYLCEVDSINERMPNRPVHVKIDFLRVAIRLSDAEGRECLAIFCELLPQ